MSRQIDYTKPLSEEDRAYLLMRGEESRVEQMDRDFPLGEDDDDEVNFYAVEDGWNKAALQGELKLRKLDTSGTADELRARLMEDDKKLAEEAE